MSGYWFGGSGGWKLIKITRSICSGGGGPSRRPVPSGTPTPQEAHAYPGRSDTLTATPAVPKIGGVNGAPYSCDGCPCTEGAGIGGDWWPQRSMPCTSRMRMLSCCLQQRSRHLPGPEQLAHLLKLNYYLRTLFRFQFISSNLFVMCPNVALK